MMSETVIPSEYQTPSGRRPFPWGKLVLPCEIFAWIGVIVGTIMRLYAARFPVSTFGLYALGWLIAYGGLILWLIATLIRMRSSQSRFKEKSLLSTILKRLGCPLVMLIAFIVLAMHLPRQFMFNRNRVHLDQWVQSLAKPPGEDDYAHVGDYQLFHFKPINGGFYCLVEGCGFFRDGGGFAYCPVGSPTVDKDEPADIHFAPAGGNWYFIEYSEP